MEAFFVSLSSVAVAEMGDRTQFLALMLGVRYRKPWPILAGILAATLLNHAVAGALGFWLGRYVTPVILDTVVGVGLIVMGLWTLKPEATEEDAPLVSGSNVALASFVAFFLAEIGDKTQIATMALAAAYANITAVVAGTTVAMMIANAPVVIIGKAFSDRLPLTALKRGAAALFVVIGIVFLVRAVQALG